MDDKRRFAVHVTEPEKFGADDIRMRLCGYVPSELLDRDIVILKAPHGWSKWLEYGSKISPAIFERGFGVTMFDIDERAQKIVIGIKKDGFTINRDKVIQFLSANNIPLQFVGVVEADPVTFD